MTLMDINLRPTRLGDLDFVLAAEQHPDNAPYVNQWSREQHEDAIASLDAAHLIVEKTGGAPARIGYVILGGLQNPHRSLLLKRIVILPKGKGFGRKTLRLVKAFAFKHLNYHRLGLDVFSSNQRAQHVYRSEGFVDEGRLREAYRTPSGYEDLILLSILSDEYRQQNASKRPID
jgi:ribosomal protein S18 acetylase RimI-like enzyme